MILRELVLHNFGPFYGRNVLSLAPTFGEERPVCLIGALNGGGKTSLLDALLLALYGKRARCSKRGTLAYPEFMLSCIHDRVSPLDGAGVELSFGYSDAEGLSIWRVVRSWRQRQGGGLAESLKVFKDEIEDPLAAETWDQRVEDLLPLGLSNLFFFDGEQVRELASEGAAPPEVRAAIRTLLGLELPARLADDLHVILRRQQKALADSDETAALEELEEKIGALRSKRSRIRMALGEERNRLTRALAEQEAIEHQFASQGGGFAQRHAELERERNGARSRAEQAREALRELAEGALPFALVQPLLGRTLKRAAKELDAENARQTNVEIAARDQRLLSELKRLGLQGPALAEFERFVFSDVEERSRLAEAPGVLDVDRLSFQFAVAVAEHQIPEALRQSGAARESLSAAQSDLERLEGLLEAAAPPEQLEKLVKQLKLANGEVHKSQHAIESLESELGEVERACKEAEHQLARMAERVLDARERHREEARMSGAATRALGVLDRYRQLLQVRKLLDLERRVEARFRHLSRKDDLVDRVEIDPDTYGLTLFDAEGRPVDRRKLSAGEQQLLAVSFLWGLAEASGRPLPVVIDTPLSRMDSKHRAHLVERYFPHVSHQVVVLSTDVEVDEPFYRMLQQRNVLDRTYLIRHNPQNHRSEIAPGYFW